MYVFMHMYIPIEEGAMHYPATFELPTTDAQTELVTGPYFRHLLREELLPEAERSGDPLTVLVLDIDEFLEINDAHGREAGDAVIAEVARVLRGQSPDRAVVARQGGDEFAAALPDTRLDDAFTLAESIRRAIGDLRFERWPEVHLATSIGLASYPAHGRRDVELMREADEALYTAKSTGRNKVSLPLADSRMVTKTSHYTATQLQRLAQLARETGRNEAGLLREALDDLFRKYTDRKEARQ
jgi:diguanylate cyclase (GGDEF)-like protein